MITPYRVDHRDRNAKPRETRHPSPEVALISSHDGALDRRRQVQHHNVQRCSCQQQTRHSHCCVGVQVQTVRQEKRGVVIC